ncbi:MAG: DUF2341 domain-containing protein [Verrucomicrobia bacterium]|nr:DUF2341 domain-containing protein [Verrucomicrobiota bacterium]
MFNRHLVVGALLALSLAQDAQAWWNGEWTQRRRVTVDPGAVGIAEPVGSAVVLVRLFDANFNFAAAREDGSDLRFVAADDKTPLPFHVERYDGLLNEAFVWVRVPELKAGVPTSFWVYYGNASQKVTKADDAKATYDADTALIFHFSEKGAPAADASGNGNTTQNPGVPVAGSLIAGGLRLDGRKALTIPANPSLAFSGGGAVTWSAWIKPAVLAPNATIFHREDGAASLSLGLNAGVPFVEINGQRVEGGPALAANAWVHLALVCHGGKARLFVQGQPRAELAASLPALNSVLLLGAGPEDSGRDGFAGEVDELQIVRAAREPAGLRFAALSQGPERDPKLLVFGPEEQRQGWFNLSGEFGIIVRNLTFDGWVVIVICVGMAIGSWFIMVNKTRYLNSMKRGNEAFLQAWSAAADDLTSIDSACQNSLRTLGGKISPEDARLMQSASIYRIYHIGAEEIRKRVGEKAETAFLSARSMQAIKASLDSGMVRETQRLNRLMVLLTICISGGPFLGLLGTVVGVMITFAAIAAAGDVNVNAIAPGIAAALLATIAGLAVAIPALFGYNYLLTRIKETTSDMAVFIDEFIARMAEFYGDRDAV